MISTWHHTLVYSKRYTVHVGTVSERAIPYTAKHEGCFNSAWLPQLQFKGQKQPSCFCSVTNQIFVLVLHGYGSQFVADSIPPPEHQMGFELLEWLIHSSLSILNRRLIKNTIFLRIVHFTSLVWSWYISPPFKTHVYVQDV